MATSTASSLDDRHLRDVTRRAVISAAQPTTIAALAALMVVHRIHGVVLERDAGPEWVSDLDVLRAAVSGDTDVRGDRRRTPTFSPDTSLRAAARGLLRADSSHALVVEDGAVVGVVSALDLCAAAAGGVVRGGAPPPSSTLSLQERRLARVSVGRIMHRGVVCAAPDASLVQLARTLAQMPVHSVVVDGLRRDDRGEHLVWGVVTDMDVVRALAGGRDDATAGALAGTEPLCVDVADRLDEVARKLCEHELTHVIATDTAGRPCGVVSTLDVLRVVACGSGI